MNSGLSITLLGLTILSIIGARPHCTYVFYYQPVCGNDGKTYINSGHLTCAKLRHEGLEMISTGQCPENINPQWSGVFENVNVPQQPTSQAHEFNNEETQTNNPHSNSDHATLGQMNHGHGNYPANGMRSWDNSREYPDNSFELHLGGGGGGMGKGLIAGAVLGKVASDFSKNKHDKAKFGSGGIGSNPFQQQPNPYAQQPNPYGHQQPNPYAQQPNPYAQQPKPYPVQPNPVAQPKPYPVQPNPYAPQNPTNTNSRPSAYNPYVPSAPAAPPAPAKPKSSGSSRKSSGRKSGGRKGR